MEKLISFFHILIVATVVMVGVGCSDTEFSQRPPKLVTQEINSGKVDILFVVDNSGSMYVEQVKMANAFPSFVSGLDIAYLDYRIGIITTDVTSTLNKQKNLLGLGSGALQDGRLIKFPDGKLYLDNKSANIQSQFSSRIRRQETLNCEAAGFAEDKCPSGDERGIYAAVKAVSRNENNFFRDGSHISFVFLTDEDERGIGQQALSIPNYPRNLLPTVGDHPDTLIEYVHAKLGESHTISAHAIVVNNETCRNQQVYQENNEYIWGQIGHYYMKLTNPNSGSMLKQGVSLGSIANGKLLNGTIGSICASNYSSQVGNIRNALDSAAYKYVSSADLDCQPLDTTFDMEYCPSGHSCQLAASKDKVVFSPALPPSKSARFSYKCP